MQAHQASHWDDTLSILQTELKGSLTREDVELGPRNLSTEWDRILGLKACAMALSQDLGSAQAGRERQFSIQMSQDTGKNASKLSASAAPRDLARLNEASSLCLSSLRSSQPMREQILPEERIDESLDSRLVLFAAWTPRTSGWFNG